MDRAHPSTTSRANSAAKRRPTSPKVGRPLTSAYAHATLRLIVFVGAATGPQLIRELGSRRKKHPAYVSRVLQRLVRHRLVSATRLQPRRGRASAMAYQITDAGLRFLAITPGATTRKRLIGGDLMTRVQFAEVILQRISEGWKPVPPARGAFPALKRWGLQQFGGRLLSPADRSARDALLKIPDDSTMRHYVLTRETDTGVETRILLHCPPSRNLRRYVKALPSFALFPTIPFEIVAESAGRLASIEKAMTRLAARRRFAWTMAVVAPLTSRITTDSDLLAAAAPWTSWQRILAAADALAAGSTGKAKDAAHQADAMQYRSLAPTPRKRANRRSPVLTGYGIEGLRADLFGEVRPIEQRPLFDEDGLADDGRDSADPRGGATSARQLPLGL